MSKRRTEIWLAAGVLALGMIPAAIAGLWGYMSITATPLHPNPSDSPSVMHSATSPQWAGAVAQGRKSVRAALTEQNLPGLSVAVGVDGDLVWAEGFGWAGLEKNVPVAPDMLFRIGTASVPLTSAAVGLLLEDGRLKLDEVIQTYVPEFPAKQWPVTLRQVMGHVAGVANDGGDEGPLFGQFCERPVDALQFLSGYEVELLFEPGTQHHYSSYGWILVSAAVEAAADEPFLAFMQKRVFDPIGMHDTKADSAAARNRATFYFPRFAADPRYGLHLMRPINYSCYAGASVFLSTPSDLVRFAMAINSGRLLQPATVQLLQTPLRLASGQETGYGLGWGIDTAAVAGAQTHSVGHDGTTLGGAVASLLSFPEHRIAVSVVSNISYANTSAIALSIAQAFRGQ
ncbi:MAG TPA: serine hydrolase domain-containing protein [Vicinamibacterales bacterium]|nr:serine hydrolase domain-containing protein [Vicinamibacterales bacterium]